MYPYNGTSTCTGIMSNTVAPVRCNWNWVDYGGTGVTDVIPAGGHSGNFEPPLAVTAGQRYIICFSNWSNVATTVPLDFVTGPGNADVSCIPLGFSMEGLNVECLANARKLSWSAPINNTTDKFEVQKSRDNVSWETIGTVYNGSISDGKMQYMLIDETNLIELEYYRLKQFSNDGDVLISPVLSVNCSDMDDSYRLYPNPSNGLLILDYESATDALLQFYDVYGNSIYTQSLERAMEPKTVQIRAENIPSGVYLYRLLLDDEMRSGTVMIQK